MDEVLRKVYKVDLNSSTASTRSYHESESRGSPGSSGSRHENNSTPEMNNLAHGNVVKPTNGVNPSNSASANLPINETVAQKLSVMEFLNFYKDIIERVDEAADADQKKYPDLTGMNQVNPIAPPLNPYNGYLQPAAQYQYPTENPYPYIEVASNDNYMYKSSPVHPSKKRNALVNRKFVTRNTSLPTISESIEKWWSEEGEYLTDSTQQQNFNFPDNTVMPEAVPPTFQPASMTAPMEVARSSDDDEEFLHAIEKIAVDLGYIENNAFKEIGETASVKSDDKSSVIDSSNAAESIASYTAAAIVFIYGDKMFVGSIGDSR